MVVLFLDVIPIEVNSEVVRAGTEIQLHIEFALCPLARLDRDRWMPQTLARGVEHLIEIGVEQLDYHGDLLGPYATLDPDRDPRGLAGGESSRLAIGAGDFSAGNSDWTSRDPRLVSSGGVEVATHYLIGGAVFDDPASLEQDAALTELRDGLQVV